MMLFLGICGLFLTKGTNAANVAIPASGSACTSTITFPIEKVSGVQGFPWKMEVFGIPILATDKWKNSGKMNHAASIMAGLLDNDNDGCVDDPNVLRNLLKQTSNTMYPTGPKIRKAVILPNEVGTPEFPMTGEKVGYLGTQPVDLHDCQPSFSGTKAKGKKYDATIEEWLHFITDYGFVAAYPKIFGTSYTSNSTLTNAMDIARGGKLKVTPKKTSDYSAEAWYTYNDTSCAYGCQAGEYLWWGYCSYSGIGAGIADGKANEFALLRKADFVDLDTDLAKLFQDSEKKTSTYRLPTKPINGTYTGCKVCKGGKSHGGK